MKAWLFVLSLLFLPAAPVQADYSFITNAEVLNTDASTPPSTAEGWRPTQLPRAWSLDEMHPDTARQAWYRIALPAEARERGWNHILILRQLMNVELWLDEHYLGSAGPVYSQESGRLQRNWNRPVLWQIPQSVLNRQPQTLYIRLHSAPDFGVMSPVFIGDGQSLRWRYIIQDLLQMELAKLSLLAMLFIGGFSLLLWWQTRQPGWLLTVLMSLCWSVPLLYMLLPSVAIAELAFLRLSHWSMVTGACFLLAFIYHFYLQTPLRKLRWLPALPLLVAAVLVMSPDSWVVAVGSIAQLFGSLLLLILLLQLLRSPQAREASGIIAGLAVLLLAVLHDVTLITSDSTSRWRWDTVLAHITQPMMLIIVNWQSIKSYLAAARLLDAANTRLQERLQEAELHIREAFAEQERIEGELRIAAERDQVYRDLHDDLGARLLSLVFRSENDETRDLARSALQDLRMTVNSITVLQKPARSSERAG